MPPKLKQNLPYILQGLFLAAFIATMGFFFYQNAKITQNLQKTSAVAELANTFKQNFTELLFEDHIKVQENLRLTAELNLVQAELEELLAIEENQDFQQINAVYELYGKYRTNLTKNTNAKLDVTENTVNIEQLGTNLLDKKYEDITTDLTAKNTGLEKQYADYLATLPPPPSANAGEGYSYTTVSTEKGTFGVYLIKLPLASVRVLTTSAYGETCKDNCATKPLAQHVQDNGGFAGMNGSYFCPPDYAACAGKINSTDFALYKSSSGKWLQEDALSWGDTGLATFNGHSANFYKKSSDYDGDSVTAGISNYPTLLENGIVVVDAGKLSSYQKDSKGMRGAIGVGNSNLYLALINNATVIDAAYAMKALGALDALNLDGGGSSAMYINGGYVVGPGRSLPNAVVLTR